MTEPVAIIPGNGPNPRPADGPWEAWEARHEAAEQRRKATRDVWDVWTRDVFQLALSWAALQNGEIPDTPAYRDRIAKEEARLNAWRPIVDDLDRARRRWLKGSDDPVDEIERALATARLAWVIPWAPWKMRYDRHGRPQGAPHLPAAFRARADELRASLAYLGQAASTGAIARRLLIQAIPLALGELGRDREYKWSTGSWYKLDAKQAALFPLDLRLEEIWRRFSIEARTAAEADLLGLPYPTEKAARADGLAPDRDGGWRADALDPEADIPDPAGDPLLHLLADAEMNTPEVAALLARFTPAQRDVLLLMEAGYNNAEIARCLGISESTVRVHQRNLRQRAA